MDSWVGTKIQSFVAVTMRILFLISTSVDTEMCCPKGKCGCQYFIWL